MSARPEPSALFNMISQAIDNAITTNNDSLHLKLKVTGINTLYFELQLTDDKGHSSGWHFDASDIVLSKSALALLGGGPKLKGMETSTYWHHVSPKGVGLESDEELQSRYRIPGVLYWKT